MKNCFPESFIQAQFTTHKIRSFTNCVTHQTHSEGNNFQQVFSQRIHLYIFPWERFSNPFTESTLDAVTAYYKPRRGGFISE